MGTLTHKAARAAYGTAIDAVLKHVNVKKVFWNW